MRGWSVERRIKAALRRVEEDGWTQAEASRWAGINSATTCRRLRKLREEREAAAQRSREARSVHAAVVEGSAEAVELDAGVSGPLGAQERRRIPPIGEFVRKYFNGFKCWNCVGRTGEPVRHEIPPFHDQIMERMTDPGEKRLLVNIPPEHSKTTNGTVFTGIYDIVRDPNIQMAVISAGEDLAKDILGQMQMLLEDPTVYEDCTANLIADWGPFNDGEVTWTQKQFVVAGRKSVERDPTVRAFGINSKIYGRRLHRIICDDIADIDNQDTAEKVDKMFKKITSILDSRVGGNGRLQVVGTRVNPADVYARLLDLSGYTVLRHPCILNYEQGVTLWPDHIDFAEAMRRKGRTTPELFELLYQNSDMMTEGGNFTREHLDRCHDEERVLGELPHGVPVTLFVGVDPAGHGKQAGYTAMVLLGVDRAGKRYLIDVVNVRSMKATAMQAQIFDWVGRYPVRSVRFETVATQIQIFDTQEYRQKLTEFGARMDWHRTNAKSGPAAKWDPHWGIEGMGPSFHNGQVSLPWGDSRSQRRVGELEEQLLRFPMEGAPTDLMMAYWIADTGCRIHLERGSGNKYGQREYVDGVPRSMMRRRRVSSRGVSRPVSGRDFGTRDREPTVPRRAMANMDLGEAELEELLDARS